MKKHKDYTDEELDQIISDGVKMYLCTAQAEEYRQFIRQNRDIIFRGGDNSDEFCVFFRGKATFNR